MRMPNYFTVYAIRSCLFYIRGERIALIIVAAPSITEACLEELSKLPIELLTPKDPKSIAGILAFRHPKFEQIQQHLRAQNIHVMAHAGRVRIAIHGYNTPQDIETVVRELQVAIK